MTTAWPRRLTGGFSRQTYKDLWRYAYACLHVRFLYRILVFSSSVMLFAIINLLHKPLDFFLDIVYIDIEQTFYMVVQKEWTHWKNSRF